MNHSSNETIDWKTYKYLLNDATDRLNGCLDVVQGIEDQKFPVGMINNVQRQLTVIGDELSRLSTRTIETAN